MIGYWQIHHSILNYLKEWNEAGVIDAVVAAGTLAAVVVALLPTIKAWWTRPKLVLEILVNASQVSETPLEGIAGPFTPAGVVAAPMFTSAYWQAALAIRNTGRTAAVGVRVVITDVYRVTDSGEIATVDFSQRALPGDGELSSRISCPVCDGIPVPGLRITTAVFVLGPADPCCDYEHSRARSQIHSSSARSNTGR